MMERETGRIVRWTDRGFGFVQPDGYKKADVFCHQTQFRHDIEPEIGMRVSFLRTETDRGDRAMAIEVLA